MVEMGVERMHAVKELKMDGFIKEEEDLNLVMLIGVRVKSSINMVAGGQSNNEKRRYESKKAN